MKNYYLILLSIFISSFTFAQNFGAEIVSYETFGEGLMVTRAKIPAVSGTVSNFFFYNRADLPFEGNEWYEYDWEIRGAYPRNGWSQIRVRPEGETVLRDAPVNVATSINISNSLLHWILIRKDDQYIYDIRKNFDINTYNYNNKGAHGGNSASLLSAGPRVYNTGGSVADIPDSKRLDFSLGITAFDNGFSGPLPNGSYNADFVVDFTRFYTFSGNNLNTSPQWQDEFNSLNYSKWQVANWSFSATQFTQNNIRFDDGKMILTANYNDGSSSNGNTNLALNGTASQSSISSGGSASRAIDNNTNGKWNSGSVTHTKNATNSWWQVDLKQDADINRIQIYNRTDCCSGRLSNFSVSVLDSDNDVVWTRFYADMPSSSLTINLDSRGRKVRVNLDGTLSLAEVKVFGSGGSSSSSGEKVVHMKKRNASGFALDGNGGAANGQNVHLWSQNTSNVNQQWVEIDRGGGYYTYRKQGTNHCLDGGGGGANNQNVKIWSCNNNNYNQHWQKVSVGSGYYKLIKRNASGYAIDGGNGGSKGQNVKLWDSSSSHQNLHWQISELSNVSPQTRVGTNDNGYFYAQKEDDKVGLTWMMENEDLPIQFEVERQNATGDFEMLGVVPADLDVNDEYNFIHESPDFGENTYRVKAIFRNYDIKYLNPQTITFEDKSNSIVFPNPSKGQLFVDLSDYLNKDVDIILSDFSGKVFMTHSIDKQGC